MKNGIIICEKNELKISEVLKKEQKGCRERVLVLGDIILAIMEIERKFCVPKKYLAGLTVTCSPFACKKAYRYRMFGTMFRVSHNGRKWKLEWVDRMKIGDTCKKYYVNTMPLALSKQILKSHKYF